MSRVAIAALVTLGATWGVDSILDQPLTGIDDANIGFVYARNIAAGHGYVYTPGYERVEGGTSILWVLICTACFLLASNPFPLLLVTNIGLCGGAVYAALSLSRSLVAAHRVSSTDSALVFVLCTVWFAAVPAFYLWNTITLMDAALWTLAIQLLVLFPVRDNLGQFRRSSDRLGLAAAVGLASLARPESLALVPGVVLLAVACAAPSMGWWAALRRYRSAVITFALVQLGLVAFRLLYFGDPVPNTYYAKVSGDAMHALGDGANYLGSFLTEQPRMLGCLLATLICVGVYGSRILIPRGRSAFAADRAAFIVSATIVGGLSLPLVTGGDHFGSFRFYQPYVLLMIVPLAHLLLHLLKNAPIPGTARQRAALCIASILLATGLGAASWASFHSDNDLSNEFYIARYGISVGEAIATALPDVEPPSIGVVTAGGTAFGHRGRTLDLLGLNWRAMAHAPLERQGPRGHSGFNTDVFWSQPPELVSPKLFQREPMVAADITFSFDSAMLNYLYSSARFRHRYRPAKIQTRNGWLSGFFLRSWLKRDGANTALVRVPWRRRSQRTRQNPGVERGPR